jgi:formylglycine-generating enzyme required for sulfatase activity
MYIPGVRAETLVQAEKVYNEALSLKGAGKTSDAITLCSRIARDYSDTIYAEKASDLSAEMQKLNDDAHARCEEAEAIARKGNLDSLIAGFKKYQEILAGPPVTLVAESKELAARRLEEIRNGIERDEEKLGAQDEKSGNWRAALERYRMVVEKFGFHGNPMASKIAQAQKRLDDCAARVQAGQEAFRTSQWDVAYHAAVAALDLVSADPDARSLLASIAPKLQPPPGMVLVPPGKYIVGGSQGNPRGPVDLPFGLFMAVKEVTRRRFAEFLHATGRPSPPGWTEPQGSEEEMPVVKVTWSEAAAFAEWARCCLPTEEQWECACRGPSGQLYPWGDRWAREKAVLGFGPAPSGSVKSDCSPYGCMDMAGNVAEWTATPWEPPTAASPASGQSAGPAKTPLYIVKGSSWAGMEEERPTRVVAVPLPKGATDVQMLLAPDSRTREWIVRYPSNLDMEYLGVIGTEDYAYVLVRKWMPGWDHWAESKFQVTAGQEIGGEATVTVEEGPRPRAGEGARFRMGRGLKPRVEEAPAPRQKMLVDFSTGCVVIKQEKEEWLDVRDPSGVTRRLFFVTGAVLRSAKVNDCKDALPAPEMTLERAVSAATRMVGRENARYINVGFRCAKALWPVTSPAEKASKAPAE